MRPCPSIGWWVKRSFEDPHGARFGELIAIGVLFAFCNFHVLLTRRLDLITRGNIRNGIVLCSVFFSDICLPFVVREMHLWLWLCM